MTSFLLEKNHTKKLLINNLYHNKYLTPPENMNFTCHQVSLFVSLFVERGGPFCDTIFYCLMHKLTPISLTRREWGQRMGWLPACNLFHWDKTTTIIMWRVIFQMKIDYTKLPSCVTWSIAKCVKLYGFQFQCLALIDCFLIIKGFLSFLSLLLAILNWKQFHIFSGLLIDNLLTILHKLCVFFFVK